MDASKIILTGLSSFGLYDSIKTYNEYSRCVLPAGIYFIALFSSAVIMGLSQIFKDLEILLPIMRLGEELGVSMLILTFIVGLPGILTITVFSPTCMPAPILATHIIISVMVNSVIFVVLFLLFKHYREESRLQRLGEEMKDKIGDIYDQLQSGSDFNLAEFLEQNSDAINHFVLIDREKEILNEQFTFISKKYIVNVDEQRRKECTICLSEYEFGDKIMIHPGCKHIYHSECLMSWICAKRECPQCKKNTRVGLMEDLMKGDCNQVASRDKSYFDSKNNSIIAPEDSKNEPIRNDDASKVVEGKPILENKNGGEVLDENEEETKLLPEN